MPTAALRVCGMAGCYNLVGQHRPCPIHPRSRKAWRTSTGSRQQRGYGAQHDALRRQVMAEEPACAQCGSEEAPTLDHITPLSQGGQSTRDNVQRLCTACNNAKAMVEAQKALRAAKKRYGFKMDAGSES